MPYEFSKTVVVDDGAKQTSFQISDEMQTALKRAFPDMTLSEIIVLSLQTAIKTSIKTQRIHPAMGVFAAPVIQGGIS